MNDTVTLARRFREVVLDGTWIANTNFKNELQNLDWKIAIVKLQNLNSIAILAQHIHYYIAGINNVFMGGSLDISDKYSFDFPDVESQQQWEKFLQTFWDDAERFARLIEEIPAENLTSSFVEERYGTYLRNIEGMIEHSYYHLGQIVLIKKIVATGQE